MREDATVRTNGAIHPKSYGTPRAARPRHRLAFVLAALAATASPARALDPAKTITQYVHDSWQAKDGLRQNAVRAIAQTPDGYLWLATQAGLVRFDGASFTLFNPQNTPALRASIILSLIVDHAGTLWIATDGGGLSRYQNGRFATVASDDVLPMPFLWSLHEAADGGGIWLGTGGAGAGLYKDGRYTSPLQAHVQVSAIQDDGRGSVWFGTATGLFRRTGDRISLITTAQGLRSDAVRALCLDRDGTLWIGTARGLTRHRDGLFTTAVRDEALASHTVKALLEDRHGSLWIGTLDAGLARLRDGRLEWFTTRDGLSDDSVLSIFEDREGSLWFGTRNGLNRLRDGSLTTITTKEGLPTDAVRTVVRDASGAVWIGTDGEGIVRWQDGRATAVLTKRQGLGGNHVKSLLVARDGSLWLATTADTLDHVANGRVVASYPMPYRVTAIGEDDRGLLLELGSERIRRFEDGRLVASEDGETVFPHVYAFFQDRRGARWMATNGGAWRRPAGGGAWTPYRRREGLPSEHVYSFAEDPEGTIWMATRGGLVRWRDGRLVAFTVRDGLFDDILFHVLPDTRGFLWMNSSRGIMRVARAELDAVADRRLARVTATTFDTTDGMKSAEASAYMQPSAATTADGRLWFVTDKGIVIVDPQHLPRNTLVPSVIVEQMTADGVVQTAGLASLGAGVKRIDLRYTAPSLLAPEKVRFKYRLDDYDREWVDAGNQRVATYANLPPGRYVFRVKAANNDGVWNEAGAAFPFSVAPHFYQTTAFLLLCVVAVIGAGWGVFRLRTRYLTGRFATILAERNRLARDIHDTIEAGLVGITLQLDVAAAKLDESPDVARERLQLARSMVRHSMAEARRSVWDLRAHALEQGDLVSALAGVARELNADGSVDTQVRVVGSPKRLPAVLEHGVYRIGQEAITNAFKHARASMLLVELDFSRDCVRLRVKDNGAGFVAPAPTETTGGFGLLGMRERANKLRGQLALRTQPGEGTEIEVELPR